MIALVGSGPMSLDYAKVLAALREPVMVVGRGAHSAAAFEQATGLPVLQGGLTKVLGERVLDGLSAAIVAVGIESLHDATARLIDAGVKRILVEKPAGLNATQVAQLARLAQARGAQVFVAYNRRFFSSVRQARRMIESDGGLLSFTFDFTEWAHQIVGLPTAGDIKAQWFLANSSHVADLAFFLGGAPESLHAIHAGSLDWHPSASRFVGSGKTTRGALFSYHANWESPGRWSVELCSARHRFILRPMESLQVVRKGSVAIDAVEVDGAELDKQFKPGLYLQTQAFLRGQDEDLCPLAEHAAASAHYAKLAGYDTHTRTA